MKLICGNCVDIMKGMEGEIIDLTISSPPYGELRDYNGYEFDFKAIAKEIYRLTKQGGVVVWVVNDETVDGSETGTSFKQALYFKYLGFNLHDTMIYKKVGSLTHSNRRYLSNFEYMFIFSKGSPKTVNLIKDRRNKYFKVRGKHRNVRNKDGSFSKREDYQAEEYGYRYNVWEISAGYCKSHTDNIAYQHPATFPEKLARDHIISWSNKGDLVFDPMMGSGTVGKMAQMLERDFIGIDISEEYVKLAQKRIDLSKGIF